MSVSICIPCYQAGPYIGPCLESVLAQTRGTWEAIVADDGSSDDGPAIVESFAQRDGRIRLVRLPGNGGAAVARNAAIRASTGAYVAFLDADDLWMPEKLAVQIAHIERRPATALLGAEAVTIGPDDPLPATPPGGGRSVRVLHERDFLFGSPGLATSSVVVRRRVLDEIGLFREHYRIVEDFNLWMRIVRRHRVEVLERPLLAYRSHPSNISRDRVTSRAQKIDMWEREIVTDPEFLERYGDRLHRRLQRMYWKHGEDLRRRGDVDGARAALERAGAIRGLNAVRLRSWLALRRLPAAAEAES